MILSLDIGTSKLSVLAVRIQDRAVVAAQSAANDADVANLPADRHEQDPRKIRERAFVLMRQVAAEAGPQNIQAIAISGQMHGVMLVDGKGEPLTHLITWRDQRGKGVKLANASERMGCDLHPGYGAATLTRLDIPEGATAVTIADYLASQLTGIIATEVTHAASWGILNLACGDWDDKALAQLGLHRWNLPKVRRSCELLGAVTSDAAKDLGIDRVRVASPIGDNQASFIGAAGLDRAVAVVNLGTGGQVSIRTQNLSHHPPMETRPMPFGGAILVGASLCGGWAYAFLRQFYQQVASDIAGVQISDEQVYQRMNALAQASNPGGLHADTRYLGTRGDPSIRGAITGINAANLNPGNLARAVLEGMVRELADMAKVAGVKPLKVIASGNAVRRNDLVRDIIAQQFGVPCEVRESREEAALGAATAAAKGLGLTHA